MRRSLVIVIALAAAAGCSGHVEKDERPAFTIDRTQPFWLEFGRGSGWRGLATVKIDQNGRVVLHRKSARRDNVNVLSWEVATLQLPPDVVSEVLNEVESNGLMALHKAYHDDDIKDGTQWVLWIKQAEREKSIYFSNSFPRAIIAFADQLDIILARAGLDMVAWLPVPERDSSQHAKEL
jgi:hypothetical protein